MAFGYINTLSDKVKREHVRYNNRYNTAIAADIYLPKDLANGDKLPAFYQH